jgi:hypothetical protein
MTKQSSLALLWFAVGGLSLVLNANATAQERKAMADIDTDGLTGDTQISAPCGADHMNLIWAIPIEFWKAAFAADPSMTPAQKAEIIGALEEYVIVGIVQADIGDGGEFDFYSEEEVRGALKMSFTDAEGKSRAIVSTDQIGPEAQQLLAALKPMLSAAMGNMGQNLHFIVVNDDAGEVGRTWDPYAEGVFHIDLKTRGGKALNGEMEGPINALFVPRKCPNGKDAHVTWKFCPWTGEALK